MKRTTLIAFILFIFSLAVYFFTSKGNTPFDHYTLLANSFLHGKLYITKNAPWLEKVPINRNDFYVAEPPLPAVLAIPFVGIFGLNFPQQIISEVLGAGCVVLGFFISLEIKNSLKIAIWSALLMGFGNIIWFLSADGSVWYLAQVTAIFFVLLAINEFCGKKRIGLIALFTSLAFLARIQMIFYLPLFILIFSSKKNLLKNIAISFVVALPIFSLFGLYNYLRFGNFLETGLKLIPGLTKEPWFSSGLFSLSYIPGHLNLLFNSYPKISNKFPFVLPTLGGLAIWITSPVFIFALLNNPKNKTVALSWITLIFIILLDLSYGSAGISQFGYRYAVDIYPILFLLTIRSISNHNLKAIHWVLLFISIIVNLWGVLFVNKLGFVA